MSTASRLGFLLGCVTLGLFVSASLNAAEEAAGDLTPMLPRARKLATNNEDDPPLPSRAYTVPLRSFGTGGSQVLSADGKRLLMADSSGLTLWDLDAERQGQPRTFALRSSFNMGSAALSPDGKLAAVVPMPNSDVDMSICFFDTAAGKQIRDLDNDRPIFGLAFSPDGRHLAVGTQQRIELWNAADGGEVRLFSSAPNANYRLLTFSPDGKMIAALGTDPDTVQVWEVASGNERASIHVAAHAMLRGEGKPDALRMQVRAMVRGIGVPFPDGETNNDSILALAFSTDNRLLAVSKSDSAIHLWDLHADRELPPLTGFRGQVSALAFSADGKQLIAVDSEGTHLSWRMAALRRNGKIRLAPLEDADFAELWDDLAESDAFRIYRARRHLIADSKRGVPLLSRHLEPIPTGDTARIQRLVKDLSSSDAGKRRKAMIELRTKHGEAALGALMKSNGGGNGGGAAAGIMPGLPGALLGGGGGNQAAMMLLQKLQTKCNTPERERAVLAVRILEEIGTPDVMQTLRKLSKGADGVELTSASKAALDHLAAAAKAGKTRQATPEQLWSELGSDDAGRAYKAMRRMAGAPEQAAALLGKELKPIPVVGEEEIAALVLNLSSDDYKVREGATHALTKIGAQALPVMKKALSGDITLEGRKRLERLVEQASSQTSVSLVRVLRAVEVLERTGTADARRVLESLSGGAPQALVTREAKASLQRLAQR